MERNISFISAIILILFFMTSCKNKYEKDFLKNNLLDGDMVVTEDNIKSCIYDEFVLIGTHESLYYFHNKKRMREYISLYGIKRCHSLNSKLINKINFLYKQYSNEDDIVYFKIKDTIVCISYYKGEMVLENCE